MRMHSFAGRLLGTTSVVALSAIAIIGAAQPAAAQNTISTGIFGGGTTLSSLAFRQLFDCYAGTTVANDGLTFSTSFATAAPSPGLLPATCTQFSTTVEGLYAAVGSGNGQRAYIADDPHQLFRGFPVSAPAIVRKPSYNPPFVDAGNANFGAYPYPRLDFAASDAPLASVVSSLTTVALGSFTPSTNWQTTFAILAKTSTVASFNAAGVGSPIQLPALEVPVAIAVDTANPSSTSATWNIQSALSPNTQAGGAIQLSAAQLCAIFSATVTDWHDSSTQIPYLDKNGVQQFQAFSDDNTNGSVTPAPYTNAHLAIKVVFRADDSGTSFILTNYLANTCPLLDGSGTFHYAAIFTGVGITKGGTVTTTPNLPSSTFVNLIENIRAVRNQTDTNDHHDPYDVDDDEDRPESHWISAQSGNQAAGKIGTDGFHAGRIGYLSPDFTQPYATTVSEEIEGTVFTVPAPLSASIQNQNQRTVGVYHPGMIATNGKAQNFIPPTPASVEVAFRSLQFPSNAATYNDWSVYNQVFPAGTVIAGVNYGGLSLIGDPQRVGAYPISGATFLQLHSCYSDPTGTRVPALKKWLAWLYGGSQNGLASYDPATSDYINPGFDPDVSAIIRNNGFHELDAAWAQQLQNAYLLPGIHGGLTTAIAAYDTSGNPQVDGCTGVTGGAP
jgi:ABC-type phosphate transport system substrate-binding protein